MSSETLDYHYGKHHRGYIDKLNELIVGTAYENLALEEIVRKSSGSIFNNAGQAWNHNFFWNCVTPHHHNISSSALLRIERGFKSLDVFQETFIKSGLEVFGSGWLWLIEEGDDLHIMATRNADSPLKKGEKAVLTCDLWEHAYYIDYRNDRQKYLESFVEIINWQFFEKNLHSAHKTAA